MAITRFVRDEYSNNQKQAVKNGIKEITWNCELCGTNCLCIIWNANYKLNQMYLQFEDTFKIDVAKFER